MAELTCPGCGAALEKSAPGEVKRCLGCSGEHVTVDLSLGDFFELLADAEDGPEKDWYAERLAELGAEQLTEELGG
jgi:hypothetical protein